MNQNASTATPPAPSADQWVRSFLTQFIGMGNLSEIPPALMQQVSFEVLTGVIGEAKLPIDNPMSLHLYRQWILANAASSPHVFAGWFNLGIGLVQAGDLHNALIAYQSALQLKPSLYQASVNLGLVYEKLGQVEVALAIWKGALQATEDRTALMNNRGRLLEDLKRYNESEAQLRASLMEKPLQHDVLQHWTHLCQKMCRWEDVSAEVPGLTREQVVMSMGPLGALALFDDVTTQNEINKAWLKRKSPPTPELLCRPEGYKHDRIRVGYVSSDFCTHPMSFLIAELFEKHDRTKFEVYGYCTSRDDGSDIRKQAISFFDRFTQINAMTDEAAARIIRSHEIDILIDLNGLTLGARVDLWRWKPAPVQITYLGYIGPNPQPELDYILCDDYVIPPDAAALYEPKPLYLDGVYQANNSKLPIGANTTREAVGLPQDKFVYCCFSKHYKITEQIFSAWMEILRRTENTVLWLAGDNEWSQANMTEVAARHGIGPDRLIFAGRVAHPDYLARLRLPDLFLDTSPYNSGTVGSDALRMELPLLTFEGKTFVSRMAGSLLTAVGLPELIAPNLAGYIEEAIKLSKDQDRLKGYRRTLEGGTWLRTLGDITGFTTRIEKAYLSVVKRPQ